MCKFNMFITAVCVLFLIKLRWPKNKSISFHCSAHVQKIGPPPTPPPPPLPHSRPQNLRSFWPAAGIESSGMRSEPDKPDNQNSVICFVGFHNGCSQSSRFLPQARGIVGSGVENAPSSRSRFLVLTKNGPASIIFFFFFFYGGRTKRLHKKELIS